jgi:hypothetical protein
MSIVRRLDAASIERIEIASLRLIGVRLPAAAMETIEIVVLRLFDVAKRWRLEVDT